MLSFQQLALTICKRLDKRLIVKIPYINHKVTFIMKITVWLFVLFVGIDCGIAEAPLRKKFPETADLVQKFDLLMSRMAFLEDTVQQQTTKITSLEKGQQILNDQIIVLKRDNDVLLKRLLECKTDCNTNVIKNETRSKEHENSKTDFVLRLGNQNKTTHTIVDKHRSIIKNIPLTNLATNATKSRIGNRRATAAGNIAFSAFLDHDTAIGNAGVVKYNVLLSNDGNGYNTFTGVFTVPVTGVYFFTFTLNINNKFASARLVKDGQTLAATVAESIDSGSSHRHESSSNTVIVHATAGQSVWVESFYYGSSTLWSGSSYPVNTFSGFLLFS